MFGSHSGFLIIDFGQMLDLSLINLLYLVPISSVAILACGFGAVANPNEKIQILKWVPITVMVLLTLTVLNEFKFKFNGFFEMMSYGYYLAFVASIVLVIRKESASLYASNLTETAGTESIVRAEKASKFCPSCGTKLSSESLFCGECGKAF